MLRIIEIKNSYKENFSGNYKEISVENLKYKILSRESYKTIFEVINNYHISPYFDIEKIPNDKEELIFEITDKLTEYLRIYSDFIDENTEIIITKNDYSQAHEGLSYHVIFYHPNKCIINQQQLKNLVILFILENNQYKDYIDGSVYSHDRLFRLPYQYGFDQKTGIKNNNNFHYIYAVLSIKDKNIWITYSKEDIVEKHLHKCFINHEGQVITFKFDKEKLRLIRRNKKIIKQISIPGIIKQTISELLTNDSAKLLFRNRQEISELDLYNKTISLLELCQNENHKKKLQEIINYYNRKETFVDFRLNLEQISGMLSLIEKCIIQNNS